jgi:hypothetical protein
MAKPRKHIKKSNEFPKINKRNHSLKSPKTTQYNCIAFAAGVTTKKWWPFVHPDAYWPPGAPYSDSVQSFIKAFETLGYEVAPDDSYIEGMEKVAFYTVFDRVKHAAIQVHQDTWASKLGDLEDIHHKKEAVADGLYGKPTVYMMRPRKAG